ncbi:hypothetical protein LCGC14_0601320 [marine sediment metagenome]|uniref:Uncharacterized protein n=1 Tax=marine sediment metagenome TaxID=412755 RepID=A0A0F9UIX2_9ZZZZ
MLGTLMLSIILNIHFFVDQKRPQSLKTHLGTEWPIRSWVPMAEGRTPVIPRGLASGTVPDEPQNRYLIGSGVLEFQPYKLHSEHNAIGPKASEKV